MGDIYLWRLAGALNEQDGALETAHLFRFCAQTSIAAEKARMYPASVPFWHCPHTHMVFGAT